MRIVDFRLINEKRVYPSHVVCKYATLTSNYVHNRLVFAYVYYTGLYSSPSYDSEMSISAIGRSGEHIAILESYLIPGYQNPELICRNVLKFMLQYGRTPSHEESLVKQ